jgi:hypothetical protein
MQTYVMFAGTEDIIHNDPARIAQPAHPPPVVHAKASVTIMLTFKAVRISPIRRQVVATLRLAPINPKETTSPAHLVVAVNGDSVKSLHASKRTLILCGAREQPAQLIHQGEFSEVVGLENICDNVQEALRRAEEVYERLEAKFVVGKS